MSLVVRLAARAWARRKRLAIALAIVLSAPWVALAVTAALTPLPPELAEDARPSTGSVIIDRHGVVIRELRADDGARARWLPIAESGDKIQRALIAAEDKRFAHHPGVDPLAITRAIVQLVIHRGVRSGASTLTQQLARNLRPRPRSLFGKYREAALALRIEASLDKRAILEQYMNRVAFGPGVRGVEAASRRYFDKPARELSLAEAAAIAAMPRGPAVYDPSKGTTRLQRRRDRVLDRMAEAGFVAASDAASAKREPITIAPSASGQGAPHLVRAVMAGAIGGMDPLRNKTRSITLTIDRGLQREAEVLAQRTVAALASKKATAAAVIVIENATGDVLAYVGSPDIEDEAKLGHNDGVLAARQPGSTLKPFVYGLAMEMEKLGFSAATVLPDVELELHTKDGTFRPNNYDGRFHGPVRVREALANSFNVPAVYTADALGPAVVLERLRALGFDLPGDADHYGAAIALGDGEVRLLDLANAYATLARGGVMLPVRVLRRAIAKDGAVIAIPEAPPKRVLPEAETFVITHILADDHARSSSFGERSALALPFPAAAKTGTSKGFRDNYAAGYTPEITVAVWVGNFDGSPMDGVSGVTGAGPLFYDVMVAATRNRLKKGFDPPSAGVDEATVCSLSGELPGPACAHTRREIFVRGTAPRAACSMHERARIDKRTGLRAGSGCPPEHVEEKSFERYGPELIAWAKGAGRPLAPIAFSPLCPAGPGDAPPPEQGRARVTYPPDGARFAIDPGLIGKQSIRIRAELPRGSTKATLIIDGRARVVDGPPFALDWPLVSGDHRVRVEPVGGGGGDEVAFSVE